MKSKSKVLIIAGSDSSGGAGIQADIKTITALGSYAMTAITAITSQNTTGVKSIVPINPKEIFNQIVFTCKDIKPDAIKIGMLHSSKVIKSVINGLNKVKVSKVILDPVMVSKGGAKLIDNKAINILKKKLLKKISLITPNIPEAEILTKTKIQNTEDMINTHGTGCTLSSAIATYYSCGKTLKKSCELATKYVNSAIRSNLNYGKGYGPVNHLNSIIIKKKFR